MRVAQRTDGLVQAGQVRHVSIVPVLRKWSFGKGKGERAPTKVAIALLSLGGVAHTPPSRARSVPERRRTRRQSVAATGL